MLPVWRNMCQKNVQLSVNQYASRFINNHYRCTWPYKQSFVREKIDRKLQYLKLQKCDFRTTQQLYIPPIVAMLLRPVLQISGLLAGRYIKRWWARKSSDEKEQYKQWYRERRNVLFGCLGFYGFTILIYYLTHLQTDPLTQRRKFIIFNKKQEDELGQMFRDDKYTLYAHNIVPHTHPIYKKVANTFNKIIVKNKNIKSVKEMNWRLTILDIPMRNSFTLPGGDIFFTLEMLRFVQNDDQLAFLVAHEMAHSLLSHAAEILSYELLLDFLTVIPVLMIWAFFPDVAAVIVHIIGQRLLQILNKLPYSRNLEKEADEVGIQLSAKACFDVREAVVFWTIMKIFTETTGDVSQNMPWLSSHPTHEDRENNLNEFMAQALQLREQSGCPMLSAVDPRIRFYKEFMRQQEVYFRRRGTV